MESFKQINFRLLGLELQVSVFGLGTGSMRPWSGGLS
jgi:hypothetical protein